MAAAAREAARRWGALTPAERSHRLLRFADLLEEAADELTRAEQAGTGKPEVEARGEVAASIDTFRFYAGAVRTDLSPASGRRIPGRESWVRWEPHGVVAAIVPWNYPLMMATWRLGPALAAGNAVILKPAWTTPDSAQLLARYATESLGPGVLSVVPGDRQTGRLLVEGDVDMIAFTGSGVAGADVQARAGIRPVSLELGGNAPAIVLPDAPTYTYQSLARACVYNAGQSCAAPARVITLRRHYRETVDRLAEAMDQCRAGIDFGPLNNPDQLARFDRLIEASAAGFRHAAPVNVSEAEQAGYWRAGLVLADLPPDDPAVVEEVFGPVLTVQAVDEVADAVALANGVPQALAASVWGGEVGRLLQLAGELDSGEVWVNTHLDQIAELPHGGRRGSGTGTDMSVLALTEYRRPKTVTVRLDP